MITDDLFYVSPFGDFVQAILISLCEIFWILKMTDIHKTISNKHFNNTESVQMVQSKNKTTRHVTLSKSQFNSEKLLISTRIYECFTWNHSNLHFSRFNALNGHFQCKWEKNVVFRGNSVWRNVCSKSRRVWTSRECTSLNFETKINAFWYYRWLNRLYWLQLVDLNLFLWDFFGVV